MVTLINVLILFLSHEALRRDDRLRNYLGFFPLLAILVGGPTFINWLLVPRTVAFQVLLPLYLTLFVNLQGAHLHEADQKLPRNLVFFVMVCSLI